MSIQSKYYGTTQMCHIVEIEFKVLSNIVLLYKLLSIASFQTLPKSLEVTTTVLFVLKLFVIVIIIDYENC